MHKPLIEQIELQKPLPKHDDFHKLAMSWKFWTASFKGGPCYKNAKDCDGEDVFIPHEAESDAGIKRRKRLATYRNYCRPIVSKYNNFIFSTPIKRDKESKQFETWAEDVDTLGTTLHNFVKDVFLKAQYLGRWWVLAESSKTEDVLTEAQAKEAGSRLFLIGLHPARVINWVKIDQAYTEALVWFREENLARLYTADAVRVIGLDETDTEKVVSIGPPIDHDWGRLPLERFQALEDEQSQIADIAEINKALFNSDALLREEQNRQTFTQWFMSGAEISDEDINSQTLGGRKILTLNQPDVKFQNLTADPSQAEQIRDTIRDDIKEVFRLAGLQNPDVVQNTESGRALRLRFADVEIIARALADNAERGENGLIDLWRRGMGTSATAPISSDYPENFDVEDLGIELEATIKTLDSDLPLTLKELQVKKYADQKFPKMSDEEKQAINEEIEQQKAEETERAEARQGLRNILPMTEGPQAEDNAQEA